eukprot:TRINITY_DN67855_c6_g5_i1.p1 TRINITY_DN67855_c6_g5~~TRINITY_DN67855_c6_g5_i1.p1  ORF type:complete len:378 (-),score=34.68 TRINITY_DN67855_c6_g5_i1:44-1177(-)
MPLEWSKGTMKGKALLPPMESHCTAICNQRQTLYIIPGIVNPPAEALENDEEFDEDARFVYSYSLTDRTMTAVSTPDFHRSGQCCGVDEKHAVLVAFGGMNEDYDIVNSTHTLKLPSESTSSLEWEDARFSAGDCVQPPGLYASGSVAVNTPQGFAMFVFGGKTNDDTETNELWQLAAVSDAPTPTYAFHKFEDAQRCPKARYFSALAAHSVPGGTILFLYGGVHEPSSNDGKEVGPVCLDDLHMFDTRTNEWTELQQTGTVPPPKNGHCLHCLHRHNSTDDEVKLVLIGGGDRGAVPEVAYANSEHLFIGVVSKGECQWSMVESTGEVVPYRRWNGSMAVCHGEGAWRLFFVAGQVRWPAPSDDVLCATLPIKGTE